jgi:lysophospholipase D
VQSFLVEILLPTLSATPSFLCGCLQGTQQSKMTLISGAIAGICVGSYIVVALLSVRIFPIRFGKDAVKKRLMQRFPYSLKHISHRGGSLNGPENTMFAFNRALREGHTDMLEMDVNVSADGVAIVSHDISLERICDAPYHAMNVADLTMGGDANSLPQLKRRIALHFPSETKGTFYDASATGTEVPEDHTTRLLPLSEVFDAFPTTPIHLDIKAKSDTLTQQVVDMIELYQRQHITVVGTASNNVRALSEALRQPPKRSGTAGSVDESTPALRCSTVSRRQSFRTFASMYQVLMVYVLFYLGILPLIPLDFDLFSIPGPTQVKGRQFANFLGPVKSSILLFFLHSPVLWKHLQRRGIGVVVWVLNDEEEFRDASKWPVNGIMTDDPIALRKFFDDQSDLSLVTW